MLSLLVLTLLLLAAAIHPGSGFAQDSVQEGRTRERVVDAKRAADWRADLVRTRELILAEHPNPFHSVSSEKLELHFSNLIEGAEELPESRLACGLIEGLAMIGDVHTGVDWSSLPLESGGIVLQRFHDSVHLIMGPRRRRELLGARLVEVGGRQLDEVLERCAVLLAEESPGGARRRAHQLLSSRFLMEGLGLLRPDGGQTFTFEVDGEQRELDLGRDEWAPIGRRSMAHLYDQDGHGERLPDSLLRQEPYAFERLDHGVVYFQWNQVSNAKEGESLASCFERLFETLADPTVQRLIIDVRQNPGGTSHLSRPLIEGLGGHERIDRPGHLFVLLGNGSGSATVQLLFALEKCTHAIFVGEPSGQGPIFYSDPSTHTLEHTRVSFRLARTHWVMSHAEDQRGALEPDLPAPTTFEDLLAGRDPAMEAALAFDVSLAKPLVRLVRKRRRPDCEVQYYGRIPKRKDE